TAELDRLLSEQFKPGAPGCAALVAVKGQIIYKKAFGMANIELDVAMQPDNVFRIGSITKQFTAVAILQLMEQGKLKLDDEITKFIPDYPTNGHIITVEHLLTHTSGIKSYTNVKEFGKLSRTDMKPEEVVDLIKTKPMEFAPGTKWSYNNSGYFLLGYIIEKITGKTYQEYLEENIFVPVGMTSSLYGNDIDIVKKRATGYAPGKDGIVNAEFLSMLLPYAAGSIQSTVEDLFKWNQALHSYKLVKKETLDMAFREYKLLNGKGTSYGYGWMLSGLQGSPTIEHGGGINGFLTNAIYLPQEDVFVALFSNSTTKAPDFTSQKMAALAIGKPLIINKVILTETELDEFAGIYTDEEEKEVTVSREGTDLFVMRSGGQSRKAFPAGKDKFFFEDSFTTVTFTRDASGKIVSALYDDRGKTFTIKRTAKELKEKPAITISEALLGEYAGEYEIQQGFTITVTAEGTRLFAQATGQGKFELFAESESKFYVKVVDAQLGFFRDDAGKVSKIILYQGG
ncbi:MAG TPA: serine hydrolase, partial [Bacteroidales bacterium]|nr:serine hydrolase [Bacteroidales bacterium]